MKTRIKTLPGMGCQKLVDVRKSVKELHPAFVLREKTVGQKGERVKDSFVACDNEENKNDE